LAAILQAIVSGLALGGIYALIAQGYYVTQITTNKLNFAQGDLLMLGGMVTLSLLGAGLPLWLAVPAAMAVLGLVGLLTERLAIRTLKTTVAVAWIMSTVGVALIARNFMALVWGPDQIKFPSPFGDRVLRLGGVAVQQEQVFVFVATLAATGLLVLFLKRSMLGKALRAVAFHPDAAALMGISPRRMSALSFGISAALAALAGALAGPITFLGAYTGSLFGLKAFAAAMVGGLEEPVGILLGGLFLGVVETLTAVWHPAVKDVTPFLAIILILALSPTGLFARHAQEKV
jgi:branched-chain amino acid transport system permease protein